MTDLVLGIRLTLDGKQVSGEIRAEAAELQKLGQAAKQSNEQGKNAAEQFTASLRKQAETLGMTKTQTLAYEASQHKLTKAQQEQTAASIKAIEMHDRQTMMLGRLRIAAATAATTIAAVFVATLKASVTAGAQMEQSNLRLEAVLKATGHQAGLTAGELHGMAEEMKGRLGIDDDALRDSMSALLLFGNVGRETFGQVLEMSANLSKVLRTDLQSAVLMLGKAFQDPEAGLTALQRAGVKFNDTQKAMMKEMVETGRQAEAMTMLLGILKEKGFNKVAESMNQGLWAATNKLGLAWDDLLKVIGRTDIVKGVVEGVFGSLKTYLTDVKNVIESGDWFERLTFFTLGYSTPNVVSMRPENEWQGGVGGAAAREQRGRQATARQAAARDQVGSFLKQFQTDAQKQADELRKFRILAGQAGLSPSELAAGEAQISAKFAKEPKKSDYDQLIASIREKTAVTQAELEGRDKLTDAEKMAMEVMVRVRDGTIKSTEAERMSLGVGLEQLLALDDEVKLRKQQEAVSKSYVESAELKVKQQEKEDEQLRNLNTSLSEYRQQLELETSLIGSSEAQREKAIELRKLDNQFRKETTDLQGDESDAAKKLYDTAKKIYDLERERISDQLDRRGAAKEVQKQLDEAKDAAKKFDEDLQRGITDALMRGFESGKDFARNFRDTLVNMFKSLVLTPVIKWIVSPLTGAITATLGGLGIPGLGNAAGTAGGIGNLLSGGSSLVNLFGGGGLQSLADVGNFFGSIGSITEAGGTFGVMDALGGFAMANPLTAIGGVLGLVGLASSLFGGSGKTPTRAIGHFGGNYGPSGLVSGSGPDPYGGDASAAQRVTDELYRRFDAAAAALGAAYTSVSFGYGANTGRNSQNPNFALSASVGGRSYRVGENVGSFRTLDDATLQLEISRGLVSALQGSILPSYLRKYFDSLVPASMDKTAIDNALAFAGSLKAIRDQLDETRDPFAAAGENLGRMFSDLSTSAGRWRDDFKGAIEAGLTPESLGRWQALSAVVAATAQLAAPLLQRMGAAIQLQDATRDLFLSDLSPLTMAQRLAEASGRYGSTLELARGGDQAALAQLSGLSRGYLTEARGYYASSPDYTAIFGQVQTEIQGLVTDTLTEQSMQFSEMGLTLKDISANTKDLDSRIAAALQKAIDAWQAAQIAALEAAADQIAGEITSAVDETTAAVKQSATDTALVLASADSANFIDSTSDPTSSLTYDSGSND